MRMWLAIIIQRLGSCQPPRNTLTRGPTTCKPCRLFSLSKASIYSISPPPPRDPKPPPAQLKLQPSSNCPPPPTPGPNLEPHLHLPTSTSNPCSPYLNPDPDLDSLPHSHPKFPPNSSHPIADPCHIPPSLTSPLAHFQHWRQSE